MTETWRRVRRVLAPWSDPLARERMRLLGFVMAGWRVLDAGCGDGAMAIRLARRGCRVVGLTNDPAAARVARAEAQRLGLDEGVTFIAHDLRSGPPPECRFDAAVCFEVLEHILDDRSALGNVAAAVRPGGLVGITVPDRTSPPLWGDHVSPLEDGSHVRQGYSREELAELLSAAGLRPIGWGGFGGPLVRWMTNVWRRLSGKRGWLGTLLRGSWGAIMLLACPLDRLLPGKRYGLFVLARKTDQ